MEQAINRASPTLGNAVGYFIILYLVLHGFLPEEHKAEAVAMAGIICTNMIMEVRGLLGWIGMYFVKDINKKEEDDV